MEVEWYCDTSDDTSSVGVNSLIPNGALSWTEIELGDATDAMEEDGNKNEYECGDALLIIGTYLVGKYSGKVLHRDCI